MSIHPLAGKPAPQELLADIGQLRDPGTFPLGTIAAVWAPGNGSVAAADGFPGILMTDCQFGEYPANGGTFCVAAPSACFCTPPVATEPSTWGKVKSLYR